MHVVTVELVVKREHTEAFGRAVLQQARNTLSSEMQCRRFDVCVDAAQANLYFLYEIYTDESAFAAHLRSPHFLQFEGMTRDWLERKSVRTWRGPLEEA